MRPRDFRCDMQAQTQTVLQAFVSAKKRLEQPFERFGWDDDPGATESLADSS